MPPAEPFGYYKDETGKHEIPEQLEALEQAKYYIKQGCSMQSVRDWVVKKTGRNITVPGLLKAIKYDRETYRASPKDSPETDN